MNEPATPPTVDQSSSKPPRSSVERVIVWGIILIGLGIAGYEARAKFGYDWTLAALTKKLDEVDKSGAVDAKFTFDDAVTVASLGPSISDEEKMFGMRKARVMKWPSIAKTYELKLILDEDNVLLTVETSEPPETPLPVTPPAGAEGMDLTAGAVSAPGGGGGAPIHAADGSPSNPAAQGAGGGGGGGQRGGGNRGLTGLLANEVVAAELSLSDEQKEKIKAFAETMQAEGAGIREIFQKIADASDEEKEKLRAQIASMRADIESKTLAGLSDLLDEKQLMRLQQIDWQRQGPAALTSAVVTEKLGLSAEQQAKVAELSQKQSSERRELGREASREDRQALTDKYNTEFAGVLTEAQTTAWTELLGEKFELPSE
jgi:hypothetical protein